VKALKRAGKGMSHQNCKGTSDWAFPYLRMFGIKSCSSTFHDRFLGFSCPFLICLSPRNACFGTLIMAFGTFLLNAVPHSSLMALPCSLQVLHGHDVPPATSIINIRGEWSK